ncbi:MAG TPA: choice-of-anchor D domain-containing protein, partial [Myxococcota bacterium]|nr:choice-of-anchor D domain-containing protein [Myxococcota bacterium]
QVFVSPTVLTFSDVPRGETARLNVEVRHIGTGGTIRLSPIRLETDSPDLSIGLIEADEIGPGEVSRIQIVYSSENDPPDFGTLVIGHNIIGNPETRVSVSTPGQRAVLFSAPQVLDFGIVQAAAPRELDLRVINGGTAPATLTGFEVEGTDAADFSVAIPDGTTVPVNGEVTLKARYAPNGRNKDRAVVTLLTEREDVSLDIQVLGEEETPVLTVSPSLVQLGWTRPGEVAARELTIKNDGNTTLEVDSIRLEGAPSVLTLTNRPNIAFTLRPGQTIQMGVVFAPVDAIPMTENPLGTIRFVSNDAARDPYLVPIYGAAGEPSILVIPDDVVDFAFVAEGFTAKRSVVVVNQGAAAVTVTGARLVDPSTDEFVFANAEVLPKTLNSGESVELQLTFENRGGADGREFAKFFLSTTDPVVPTYPLDVVAGRAQRPTCEAAFVPDLLAMGAYRPTQKGTGKLIVMNTGSGNCEYREHEFDASRPLTASARSSPATTASPSTRSSSSPRLARAPSSAPASSSPSSSSSPPPPSRRRSAATATTRG